MQGVGSNLDAMLEDRYHRGGKYEDITDRADAPIEDAISLMVRERLTGRAPAEGPRRRSSISGVPTSRSARAENLDALLGNLEDQNRFARSVREIAHLPRHGRRRSRSKARRMTSRKNEQEQENDEEQEGEGEEGAEGERADVEITDDGDEEMQEGAQEAADGPTSEMPEDMEDAEIGRSLRILASAQRRQRFPAPATTRPNTQKIRRR